MARFTVKKQRKRFVGVQIACFCAAILGLVLFYRGQFPNSDEATVFSPDGTPIARHLLGDGEESNEFPQDYFSYEEKKNGAIILHMICAIYMFIALAIVCDDYFVSALELISERLEVKDDVAGATFMAAGGSAPELATSLLGVFVAKNDIGFGTIVGSAVFNILFVISACIVFAKEVLELEWWPLTRDSFCYGVSLLILVGFVENQSVEWYEALVLFCCYIGYIVVMYYNEELEVIVGGFFKKLCCKSGESVKVAPSPEETEKEKDVESGGAPQSARGRPSILNKNRRDAVGTCDDPAETANNTRISAYESEKEADFQKRHSGVDLTRLSIAALKGTPEMRLALKKMLRRSQASAKPKLKTIGHAVVDSIRNIKDKKESTESFDLEKTLNHAESSPISPRSLPPLIAPLPVGKREDGSAADQPHLSSVSIEEFNEEQDVGTSSPQNTNDDANGDVLQKSPAAAEEAGEGEEDEYEHPLTWPDSPGAQAFFLFKLPLVFLMYISIPDCRTDKWREYFPLTFVMSLVWIASYAYLMVWMATEIGITFDIPPTVMGITILAAGTSVPDAISSVIVARQGLGDMAVSSSIGSNIFDVLVGLPIPWLLKTGIVSPGASISIQSDTLAIQVASLFLMLFAVIAVIVWRNWRLDKELGWVFLFLYFLFVAETLLLELGVINV